MSILALIGFVCLVTGAFDMMGNGAEQAQWAPYGLTITFLCGFIIWIGA